MKTVWAAALLGAVCAMPAHAETRALEGESFHAIDARGPYQLNIVAGALAARVAAEGTTQHLSDLEMHVENGVLQIRRHCSGICHSNGTRAVIEVSAPALDSVAIGWGADATVRHVAADSFNARASMGSDLTIDGTCGSLTAAASMGADVHAANLHCSAVSADASMGADMTVFASQSINARAGMGADIRVAGKPRQRAVHGGLGADVTID
jgi:Putative auto-transporter adhesin, head GIN domain